MHHVHQFVDEVTLTRCQLIWRRERRRRQQERGKKTSDKRGAHSGSFGESNVVRAQMIVLNNRTVPSNVREERPEPGHNWRTHAAARSSSSARWRALRVSDAARPNSSQASPKCPSLNSRSARTLG